MVGTGVSGVCVEKEAEAPRNRHVLAAKASTAGRHRRVWPMPLFFFAIYSEHWRTEGRLVLSRALPPFPGSCRMGSIRRDGVAKWIRLSPDKPRTSRAVVKSGGSSPGPTN